MPPSPPSSEVLSRCREEGGGRREEGGGKRQEEGGRREEGGGRREEGGGGERRDETCPGH